MVDHTRWKKPSDLIGTRFEVFKRIVVVGSEMDPIEINPVKVGDVVIAEDRENLWVGKYTGAAVTPAQLKSTIYFIVFPLD